VLVCDGGSPPVRRATGAPECVLSALEEVRSASCQIERSWEFAELEVTRSKPNKAAGQVLGGIGVGMLSFSTSLWYLTDNDSYLAGAGLGIGALIVGLATSAQKTSVQTKRSNVEQRTTNESGPCLPRGS
jgi:hypothetical protein